MHAPSTTRARRWWLGAWHQGYYVVRLPYDVVLDDRSVLIHGITREETWAHGMDVRDVLFSFFRCIEQYSPDAIVGHDVMGDVNLLVSELLYQGCSSTSLPSTVCRLICTRMLATQPCAIPLPPHVKGGHRCDALLRRFNRSKGHNTLHPLVVTASSSAMGDRKGRCARGTQFKWPSLQECYTLLVGKGTEGLKHANHDARGDVERCRAIFIRLLATSESVNPAPGKGLLGRAAAQS